MTPGHQHVDQILSDFAFAKEHLEDLVAEKLLQGLGLKSRCDSEHALAIKTAIRAQNVAMGIESKKIAKRLYGDDSARNGILFRQCFLEKRLQRLPTASTKIREKAAIIEEISPQNLWYAKSEMAVRYGLKDFLAKPFQQAEILARVREVARLAVSLGMELSPPSLVLDFEDELVRIGYKGTVPAKKWPVHCYYEYHIEQGPILEREGKIIGAPKGILCLHWYDVYLEGEANQVGPTPMEGRHDALCAVAEMILKVNELPGRMGGNMVATVGEIQNYPNSRNIIPDKVHFTVDIRSWDDDHAIKAWELVRRDFEDIAARRGCPIKIEETWRVEHSPFDEQRVQLVLDSAEALGYSSLYMVSGAGHDASYMNQVCPTAMVFIPSIGGRSHVEVEKSRWEDCEAGANVLLHAILQSANEK